MSAEQELMNRGLNLELITKKLAEMDTALLDAECTHRSGLLRFFAKCLHEADPNVEGPFDGHQ